MHLSTSIRHIANLVQASKEMFFHGTCTPLANKILTQGFNPDPSKKVWGDPDDPKRSYGGTYLSKNFMVAYGAAHTALQKFGGNRVVFEAQIETRTGFIDEDEIPGFEGRFLEIAGVILNPATAKGMLEDPEWLDETLEEIIDAWLKYFEESRAKIPLDKRYLDRIRKPLKDYIMARLQKESRGEGIGKEDSEVRRTKTILMKAIGNMARMKIDLYENMENIRVLDPIKFSGANKIISATEIIKQPSGLYTLKSLHGHPSHDFIDSFKRNVSGDYEVE